MESVVCSAEDIRKIMEENFRKTMERFKHIVDLLSLTPNEEALFWDTASRRMCYHSRFTATEVIGTRNGRFC